MKGEAAARCSAWQTHAKVVEIEKVRARFKREGSPEQQARPETWNPAHPKPVTGNQPAMSAAP